MAESGRQLRGRSRAACEPIIHKGLKGRFPAPEEACFETIRRLPPAPFGTLETGLPRALEMPFSLAGDVVRRVAPEVATRVGSACRFHAPDLGGVYWGRGKRRLGQRLHL